MYFDDLKPGETGYWNDEGVPIKITRIRIGSYAFEYKDYEIFAYDYDKPRKYLLSEVYKSGVPIDKKRFDILIEKKKYQREIEKIEEKAYLTEEDKKKIKGLEFKMKKCSTKYSKIVKAGMKKLQENVGSERKITEEEKNSLKEQEKEIQKNVLNGKNINIKLKNTDHKSAESIAKKAMGKYNGEINLRDFTDIVRSRYIIDKEKDLKDIIEEIEKKFGKTNIEMKNNFEEVRRTGFRDIILNIIIDGQVVELQIVPKELNDINDVIYNLYEKKRHLELLQEQLPEVKFEIIKLDNEINKLNNAAWEAFKKRQFKQDKKKSF